MRYLDLQTGHEASVLLCLYFCPAGAKAGIFLLSYKWRDLHTIYRYNYTSATQASKMPAGFLLAEVQIGLEPELAQPHCQAGCSQKEDLHC